jgi:hypothetical protein
MVQVVNPVTEIGKNTTAFALTEVPVVRRQVMAIHEPVEHCRTALPGELVHEGCRKSAGRPIESEVHAPGAVPHGMQQTVQLLIVGDVRLLDVDILTVPECFDCVIGMGGVIRCDEYESNVGVLKNNGRVSAVPRNPVVLAQ